MINPLFCRRIRNNRKSTNDEISHEVIPKLERNRRKMAKGTSKDFYSHRNRTLYWRITHIQNQATAQINTCKNYTPSSTLITELKVPIYQTTQSHIHKNIIYKAICRYYNKTTMKLFFCFNTCNVDLLLFCTMTNNFFFYFVLWSTNAQLFHKLS